MHFSGPLILRLDAGARSRSWPASTLAATSCSPTERVRTLDLKGKTVAIRGSGCRSTSSSRACSPMSASTLARTSSWVDPSADKSIALLAEGKIDAFMGFPPDPQELRARKIGHVVVNSNVDRPWSQYFCCMVAANREFVAEASRRHQARPARHPERHRCLRLEPDRASRCWWTAGGRRVRPVRQVLKEIPYDRWRDYNPEDTRAVLRAAPSRGGHDQIDPAENHR